MARHTNVQMMLLASHLQVPAMRSPTRAIEQHCQHSFLLHNIVATTTSGLTPVECGIARVDYEHYLLSEDLKAHPLLPRRVQKVFRRLFGAEAGTESVK